MDSISNNVTKNQMTFGLVTQKNAFGKKTHSQTTGQSDPRFPANQKSANNLFDNFSMMNDYLEKQEKTEKEDNIFKTQTKEEKKPQNHATEELLSASIFNKKETKRKHREAPIFNVLSLFKPGEILEGISKKEQEKSKEEATSPFV